MLNIITVEEVQRMLNLHDISYSDEKVELLIEYYINKITGLTGIDFDVKEYHYSIENKRFVRKVVLPLFNIFDVDEVHVDWKLLNDKYYYTDTKNGVVFMKPPLTYVEHLHIKYLTRIDDSIIERIIKPLLIDMIIDGYEEEEDGLSGDITSIHEGNTSISLSNGTSRKSTIQNRLDKLTNGDLPGVGKNKKGVMFI